ncbi:MAG: HXXEE domain-containing protein [Anaeromyxobacteraceae bacterium]
MTRRAWRALLAAGAAVVVLHVTEQLFTAPAFVDALSGFTLGLAGGRSVRFSALVYAALGWAGLVGVGAFAWAASEKWPRAATAAAAWVAVLLVASAASHLWASIRMRHYTPGLFSGVLAGAPFGVYFVALSVRGGRLGRRAMTAVVTLGVLLAPVALLVLYVIALATLYALSAVGAVG